MDFTSRFILIAAVATAVPQAYAAEPASAIVGHVRYVGARVAPPIKVPPGSQADCGKTQPSQALIVGEDKGLANAVISVEGAPKSGPLAPADASVNQEKCVFEPHVLAVPVGSRVMFVNTDVCLHNVHVLANGATVANIGMPVKGQHSKLPINVLAKPGSVTFKCDVHSWMNGYVHVFDHPYFAVSDRSGAFRIAGVPPGTYQVKIQHELLGTSTRNVTVPATGDAIVDAELK